MRKFYILTGLWAALFSVNAQQVATFDDVALQPDTYYNGSDGAGGFSSGGFWFYNDYNADWRSWSGFSVSNMKDTITPGYENQFSVIAGAGANGSGHYAVVFYFGELKMEFESPAEVKGFFVTNSTYAYLAMRDGSEWTKPFGGATGTDPDYFKLTVWGTDPGGNLTDTIEFLLADFRFENPDENYILKEWEWLELSSLGTVTALHFGLESSDVGEYGMNTPAYFCIDDFTALQTPVSAPQVRQNAVLNVFPNPVYDNFYVDIPTGSEVLNITDASGKILLQKLNPLQERMRITELNKLPSGMYFVNAKTKTGRLHQKIIKL